MGKQSYSGGLTTALLLIHALLSKELDSKLVLEQLFPHYKTHLVMSFHTQLILKSCICIIQM